MISANLGRIFEVGFNIGSLAYIEQQKIPNNFGDYYRHDLKKISFPKIVKNLIQEAQLIGSSDRKTLEKWSYYFLQKGFLSGFNFFREYIHSTGWKPESLKIVYYQCSFAAQNSIGISDKSEKQALREVLPQLASLSQDFSPDEIDSYVRRYQQTGEFLQSDLLMLLQHRQELRILCVDLSVFSPNQSTLETKNLGEVEVIRKLLIKEINYLRSKSVFSNLRIDTSSLEMDFSEDLQRYFTAFKYKDKESNKLIQAASYAHSFYGFLQEKRLIPSSSKVFFNVVGYSDRGISAICLRQNQLSFLENCSQIYKNKSADNDINKARREVLNNIRRQAAHSFQDGQNFITRLSGITQDSTLPISHTERIDHFCNSIDVISDELAAKLHLNPGLNFRQAHAQLIVKSLTSPDIYIFLTGNPGIGKTTAIANFLKQHIDEGFLLFYVSPRKQVNLDIIEKFKTPETGLLCDERLFCLNTNSDIIKSNFGRCTVKYNANNRQDNFTHKTVTFLSDDSPVKHQESHQQQITRKGENSLQPRTVKTRGVLDSICEGIYTLINSQISHNIVATVSIQSLKITVNGQNTLAHFEKIFQDACNKRDGQVIATKMQAISSRIKHLFIMIDEITGDDGGVEFLNGISRIINNYQLTKHGFNIKIIVADASIVDPDVIQQHLDDPSPEPDKIYFKKLVDNSEKIPPLQVTPFEFKRLAATVINANSYPARSLELTYKIFIETVKFSENATLFPKNSLIKLVQSEIVNDINERLAKPGVEQLIVYIQDKQRLAELIEKIQSQRDFKPYQDYLEIHANISEEEKEKIQECKNQVNVIFMTASGSRGLSFPKTKHILVDIPRFQIEKNLMELIQVIYRGRGEDEQGKTLDSEEKELVFYLSEKAVYYEDEPELSLQESKLNLLNILLILKTSIMTRIIGYGNLGRQKFLMIPIGRKSVSAAGDTFTSQMANLIKELKSEHRRQRANKSLEEVYTSLEKLFSQAEFILINLPKSHTANASYLKFRENFNKDFIQRSETLDGLLNYGNIEPGHIYGSLLVVPLADKKLEERYQMRLYQQIKKYVTPELLQKMRRIANSRSYPENLRTAIKGGAIELVKLLNGEIEKTQYFEQESQRSDQYYALPFFAFISGEEMSQYFAGEPEEPEDQQFRDILATYVRTLNPVGSVLPIGEKYYEFPFVLFRSYSLEQMREKIFTDKYLLTSNELNILNLILSK